MLIQKKFTAVAENTPGEKWQAFYQTLAPEMHQFQLNNISPTHPSLNECETALKTYMPKLYPIWQDLCRLTQADNKLATLLTLYCPPTNELEGSQATWTRYTPVLVKNYHNKIPLCEGQILKSRWFETEVIASTHDYWGVLDGMNEFGLSVSFTHSGSDVTGKGFAISLVLRYILEFCKTTADAIETLKTLPCHKAYNITLLDAITHFATVEISPIEAPKVTHKPFAVDQQGNFDLSNYATASNAEERKQTLIDRLYDPLITLESFLNGFEYDPLFANYQENKGGTLYTAIYNPQLKAMEYRWPYQIKIYQSFEYFIEQEITATY